MTPLSDPGPVPELSWLPVKKLVVDRTYQRSIETRASEHLIDRIVAGFRWSAFQVITAVANDDGTWSVVDGQHRAEAAKRRGIEHVPAIVVAAPSVAEQASIFVAANSARVAASPFAIFHAALAAGDPKVRAIADFAAAKGIVVPRYAIPLPSLKPRETLAIGVLKEIVASGDPDGEAAVDLLLGLWPASPGALSAALIRATWAALATGVDRADLVAMLGKQTPAVWAEEYAKGAWKILLGDLLDMLGEEAPPSPPESDSPYIWPDDPRVDPLRRAFVNPDGSRERQSPQEWTIFEALASRENREVSNDLIMSVLYPRGERRAYESKIINVLVCRLRKSCPFPIENVWGRGYLLRGFRLEPRRLTTIPTAFHFRGVH